MQNEGYTKEELEELKEISREPIMTMNLDDHVRIFLVGPHIHFAITDVWMGYYNALQKLNIDVVGYPTFQYKTLFADDMLMKFIHSMATDPREGFTHVVFIGGMGETRWWILDSLKKIGIHSSVIVTEDPHQLDQNEVMYKSCGIYFTNEREVTKVLPGSKYLPTAGSLEYCRWFKDEKTLPKELKCDILHLGALYPNRGKFLKEMLPWIKKNNYKFIITGAGNNPNKLEECFRPYFVPIKKISVTPSMDRQGTLNHADTVMMYNCAKVVLNINRLSVDIDRKASSNVRYQIEGTSMNPRCYEVPMCGSVLATDKSRSETFEVFGKDDDKIITFENLEEFQQKTDKLLKDPKARSVMREKGYNHIAKNHSYQNRAVRLVKFLLIQDGRNNEAKDFILRMGLGVKK